MKRIMLFGIPLAFVLLVVWRFLPVLSDRPASGAAQNLDGPLYVMDGVLPESVTVPAGPVNTSFDTVRSKTASGATAVVGLDTLRLTENDRLASALYDWCGARVLWFGYYIDDPGRILDLPQTIQSSIAASDPEFSLAEGQAAVLLYHPEDQRVVVLRRGIELERDFLRVRGNIEGQAIDTLLGLSFAIVAPVKDIQVDLTAAFGFSGKGEQLAAEQDIPREFPIVWSRTYSKGLVRTVAFDLGDVELPARRFRLLGSGRWTARFTLDEPADVHARLARLVDPVWRYVSRGAAGAGLPTERSVATPQAEFRAVRGQDRLERRLPGGEWHPWFVKGVNIGPATPGHWFTDPPVDEETYARWLQLIAEAGFNAVRVYTLLPPAFYRALAVWNVAAKSPDDVIYLFQEIWPEELVPDHDLLDRLWLDAYLAESDLVIDALCGQAAVAPRSFRAWGGYGVDVRPWLAGVLIGRELEPQEVLATAAAHPDYRFTGQFFQVPSGHPAESVLAAMAERAVSRLEAHGSAPVPIGFVSWPLLDTLRHWSEWPAATGLPPHNDRAELDLSVIGTGPEFSAGMFAAFHVYPNYPDFMLNNRRYTAAGQGDPDRRYAAYLAELRESLNGLPLLVAEFGLATGYGTAHLHPEGYHHGGLSEDEQSAGLVSLFQVLADTKTAGGVVFQWADEWAKKTWTTEPYMVPYERNPLWHNVIDPEQNYGIMAWTPLEAAACDTDRDVAGLSAWVDPGYLHLVLDLDRLTGYSPPDVQSRARLLSGRTTLSIGLDTVPGRTGEFRLYQDPAAGPLAPQGSEFVVRLEFDNAALSGARLLVHADYNRGGGRLYPRYSESGAFTTIQTLVNAWSFNLEGNSIPSRWEDGSLLSWRIVSARDDVLIPLSRPQFLVEQQGSLVQVRLPWSRLNFADPSGRRILLDPVRDSRSIISRDTVQTVVVDSVGVWGQWGRPGQPPALVFPDAERKLRISWPGWEYPEVGLAPKLAYRTLSEFLRRWDP